MNMLIALLSVFFLWQPKPDSLNLQTCYQMARNNSPISRQLPIQGQIANLKTTNAKRLYLPQLALNGKASYQNDVTHIPITLPNVTIPTISKDQYQVSLSLNQPIYDGGNSSIQTSLAKAEGKVNEQSIEVNLYQIHQQVNAAYFHILLLRKNAASLSLMKKQLESRLKMVKSQVKNGALLPGSQDALEAELLKTKQSISGVKSDMAASYNVLGELIGKNMSSEPDLASPDKLINEKLDQKWMRPEYKLFNLQMDKLNVLKKQTKVPYRPKLSAFAETMYGRPGLNIFKNEFQTNYIVGVRLSWNLWNWHTGKRNREILQLQQNEISDEQANFTKNIKMAVQQDLSDISKYKSMISKDKQIIKLREKVEQQSASQLHNGVITPTEYITDLYAVYQARLAMDQHEIQWMMAKINYLTKIGAI